MNTRQRQKSLLIWTLISCLLGSSLYVTAQQMPGKAATSPWKLADFALDLNASLAPDNHVWVGSGQVTVQPQARKTFGIGEWNAPPFAGRSFTADINLRLNGHTVPDAASYGKGDVGLLYQGGTWYPHQIIHQGTYQHDIDGQRLSVRATSALVPLTGQVGFVLKITLTNRGAHPVSVDMTPEVNPGRPIIRPLDKWEFVSLVQEIFNHLGPDEALYKEAKRLVLAAEQAYPEQHGLFDFGTQHNLLEMRGTGWEHITASPNAERATNLDRLAHMAGLLKIDQKEAVQWQLRAKVIRQAVVDELWSSKAGWFINKTTDGKTDTTYSIQVFDAVRAAVGNESIRNAVFAHLKPGKFLGAYGVSSVSREDSVHYEVNDPDWSGGGAYMGEGPTLALTLYELGRSELAWEVLQRFFWQGEHLAYFPQEQLADRPALPAHKRANVISGMGGAETILYGLVGFGPQPDGSVMFNPQPPRTGTIKLRGLGYRAHRFDIDLSATACRISMDGREMYRGIPKRIKVL